MQTVLSWIFSQHALQVLPMNAKFLIIHGDVKNIDVFDFLVYILVMYF